MNGVYKERSSAGPREGCAIQGVRSLNGQDESGEDHGSVAADRWRHRCVRQAAERQLGQLRHRRTSSGRPGYSKARTWPRSRRCGGEQAIEMASRQFPRVIERAMLGLSCEAEARDGEVPYRMGTAARDMSAYRSLPHARHSSGDMVGVDSKNREISHRAGMRGGGGIPDQTSLHGKFPA